MIAANVATMALLTPKLEIVSVDPNYMEYDWDDCRTTASTSSSSGFRSHENYSEDLFEDDLVSKELMLNHADCQDNSITSDPIFEKILDEELLFSQDSVNFNKICFPLDSYDSYSNVVNWLDSTPVSPLFAKPIKITAEENDYNLKVLPNLNQKHSEIRKQTQAINRISSCRFRESVQTDCNIRFPTLESWEKSKINYFAQSKSRSQSSSSRSSFNSLGSDRWKRKRSDSAGRSTTARTNNNNNRNGSKQGFEKSYKRSRQETDERCTVYVGRIETTTSKDDLKKKFERYGPIREVSTHKKENGMKFGFVTFKSAKDAYITIDGSTTDTAINMYDISFGGRRAFCKETYLDLDNIDVYQQGYTIPAEPQSDSFEDLLRKVKLEIKSSQKHIK